MIINYLKLAFRLLVRNPFFTLINLTCLSVGFAMFFMLWQHAQNELHSDQYHKDFDRIVRIGVTWNWTDDGSNWQQAKYGTVTARATESFLKDFGDFDAALEIYNQGIFESSAFGHHNEVYMTCINDRNERQRFVESNIAYADSNLFDFFTIPLLRGNSESALNGLRSTVLSQSTAYKYFGNDDPLGKVIYLNDSLPLTITGVFKDMPSNTHLNFSIVISTLHLGLEKIKAFQFTHGYLKLKKGVTIAGLRGKLERYTETIFGAMMKARNGNLKVEFNLLPLQDVPFTAATHDAFTAKSKHFLVIIRILAFVILSMAWVNYVNLARANNQQRLKELGARKSVGATTRDFVKQFLLESVLINVIAFVAALTLIQLLRDPAAIFFQFQIADWSEIGLSSWTIVLTALLSGILITGLYPAWITINASASVLFGGLRKEKRRNPLSIVLTTFQYACAIVLIAWVISINLQLNFIFTKDIGINRENIVIVELPFKRDQNYSSSLDYFMNQVGKSPAIIGMTASSCVVGDVYLNSMTIKQRVGSSELGVDSNGGVDENFIPFYGIKLIAGRNFSPKNAADKHAIIISRLTTERMGLSNPEDALGVDLEWPSARIIGVTEDYSVRPLMSEYASSIHGARGIALTYGNTVNTKLTKNKLAIKVRAGMTDEAVSALKKVFGEVFPSAPFQSYFLDNHINQYYTGERIFLQQIFLFTGIAIFIACLGLLGMMRIKVLEYAKELAIRKVFGATLQQLSRRLLTPAFRQVIIATLIALPISYYLDTGYLEKFSERITLGWWHYFLPISIFLGLLLATISSLILEAARANPVDALHHD